MNRTKAELLAEGAALMDDFLDWCNRVHGTVCSDGKITWDDLGAINGTSGNAIRNRCLRRNQSQNAADANRTSTLSQQAEIRHARRVLRDPDRARDLLEDPELREQVQKVADNLDLETSEPRQRPPREPRPEPNAWDYFSAMSAASGSLRLLWGPDAAISRPKAEHDVILAQIESMISILQVVRNDLTQSKALKIV